MVEVLKVLFIIFELVAILGIVALFLIEVDFFDFLKKLRKKPQKNTVSETSLFIQKMRAEQITRNLENSVQAIKKYENEEVKILEIKKPSLDAYEQKE